MAVYKQFEDLEIWQIANEVAVRFYEIPETDKLKNDWGLKDQIKIGSVNLK